MSSNKNSRRKQGGPGPGAPPPLLRSAVIRINLSNITITVPTKIADYPHLSSLGVTLQEGGAHGKTHPIAAATRRAAEAFLLSDILLSKARIIIDWYGSARTQRTLGVLQRNLNQIIPYANYRPAISSKDIVTAAGQNLLSVTLNPHLEMEKHQDVAIYGCDLYAYRAPLDLFNEIEKTVQATQNVKTIDVVMYILVQVFDSGAGITFGESPYIVDEQSVVHQRPAVGEPEWPNTFANEWWLTESHCRVDSGVYYHWAIKAKVGDYYIFKAARSSIAPPLLLGSIPIAPMSHQLIETLALESTTCLTWTEWFKSFYETTSREVQVFIPAKKFMIKYHYKAREAFQINTLQLELTNLFDKEEYRPLWESGYVVRETIFRDTMQYIMYGTLDREEIEMNTTSTLFGKLSLC